MREKKSKKNQQDSNIDERREKIFFYLVMVRKRCIEWNLINIFSICDEPWQTMQFSHCMKRTRLSRVRMCRAELVTCLTVNGG